ncbi:AraC family transcriptional regulator [Pedobacter nutrimenti]|jgi:YesN/AraC family two-component response regulator|uniref:AraC-like DNA-binding protein n=1 Tax=Pedobacter nutrimenti TaxID=1241337 RepID=A0A318UNP4_9SPHI|nr:AraC family transcriptional regulator [Pedobacter nutrimenti]PYF77351.1 AraC-like DNA-binding protein [Pedobacter nutrimenti]|eukprot:gene2787-3208_t
MKVLPFTLPVASEHSIVVQEDILPEFYSYFHRHREFQITLIIKGAGTLIVGNYTQLFKPGDIYFIGKDQPHIFRSDHNESDKDFEQQVHAIHIFFDPKDNLSQLMGLPEMEFIRKFLLGIDYALQAPEAYTRLLSIFIKKIRNTEGLERLLLFIQLMNYCVTHVRDWKTLSIGLCGSAFTDAEGVRMNDVYHYTIDHYSETITLKTIASIACITPHSFCKYFKKHTRKTYLSFLNEIRVNEACKKIVSGDFVSIAEVAYSTGFNSIITFNRVFKKTTSMSPKDYIRKYKLNALDSAIKNLIYTVLMIFCF